MLDAGVKLAFGTDAPVEPPDTWRNIQAALDIGKEGVYADESISLLEAMKGYTSSAALASNFPALGRIKKGASATIALYDEDPFEYVLKGKDLKELRPVSVIVEGETLL
jgi:predicted amidohydrolase YtcJ